MINQNEQIWNPVPRFEKIDNGFCPDCGEKLNDNGHCVDCHLTPSLDPEFQEWLFDQTATIIAPIVGLKESKFGLQEQMGLREGFMSRYKMMTQKQADEINANMDVIKWVRVE